MHVKQNTKWWHNIFYKEEGRYSTNHQYWDVRVIWLFNRVVYEKTLKHGFTKDLMK